MALPKLLEIVAHTVPYLFSFLNQARVGLKSALTWFLKIDPVQIIGMRVCVCVSAPKAINNQWCDMDPI